MNKPCLKLTAYFGERQRAAGDSARFLADEMLDLFGTSQVADQCDAARHREFRAKPQAAQ
jgi:hypothetical protein